MHWEGDIGVDQRNLSLLVLILLFSIIKHMKAKHRKTLELLFSRPTPASVKWNDAVALLIELGAEITEREGSRVAVFLFGQIKVMHRPQPSPDMDKGAVASIRRWLEENGVKP